ncbi:MAG TPA: ABC transporter ATP-binding protein [Bryobacteraceae bacterium]|jgi:ABC-2 type transport system ATP-binding protein|nr:ABC transporter ATP-binding protein [Bryobacteraceae bacterium]
MTEPMTIETAELRKSYGSAEALRGLNLKVPAGSIYGFPGKDGAGKTTTIKILLGMSKPTTGRASVFGLDAGGCETSVAIRGRTGFVSEDKDLIDSMTVEEMIRFTAAFYPHWRRDLQERYLRKFELPEARQVEDLSRGMRTKPALLLALSRGAELLILDEPTSGLDPAAIEEVLQAIVAHVANEGNTVFFSSHQITEVDQIADHVTILDRGQAVVAGAIEDLRDRYRRVQVVFDGDAPKPVLHSPGIVGMRTERRTLTVFVSAGAERIVDEVRALNPVSVDVIPVTLKEIFLETVAKEN